VRSRTEANSPLRATSAAPRIATDTAEGSAAGQICRTSR